MNPYSQPSLFDMHDIESPLNPGNVASFHEIQARKWMSENPEAMAMFELMALQAARTGHKFGMKLLAERVRWEISITRGREGYKINNNHTAFIARELARRQPCIVSWLEFRTVGGR